MFHLPKLLLLNLQLNPAGEHRRVSATEKLRCSFFFKLANTSYWVHFVGERSPAAFQPHSFSSQESVCLPTAYVVIISPSNMSPHENWNQRVMRRGDEWTIYDLFGGLTLVGSRHLDAWRKGFYFSLYYKADFLVNH